MRRSVDEFIDFGPGRTYYRQRIGAVVQLLGQLLHSLRQLEAPVSGRLLMVVREWR